MRELHAPRSLSCCSIHSEPSRPAFGTSIGWSVATAELCQVPQATGEEVLVEVEGALVRRRRARVGSARDEDDDPPLSA
jgi:hypothetical protein